MRRLQLGRLSSGGGGSSSQLIELDCSQDGAGAVAPDSASAAAPAEFLGSGPGDAVPGDAAAECSTPRQGSCDGPAGMTAAGAAAAGAAAADAATTPERRPGGTPGSGHKRPLPSDVAITRRGRLGSSS